MTNIEDYLSELTIKAEKVFKLYDSEFLNICIVTRNLKQKHLLCGAFISIVNEDENLSPRFPELKLLNFEGATILKSLEKLEQYLDAMLDNISIEDNGNMFELNGFGD